MYSCPIDNSSNPPDSIQPMFSSDLKVLAVKIQIQQTKWHINMRIKKKNESFSRPLLIRNDDRKEVSCFVFPYFMIFMTLTKRVILISL